MSCPGRPMIYACSWPVYQTYSGMTPNYTSIINTCNLWRNFDDIQDSWSSVERTIDYYGDNQVCGVTCGVGGVRGAVCGVGSGLGGVMCGV